MKLSGSPEKQKSAAQASTEAAPTSGKGRPTPSRKEAEAAAKERARAATDKKAAQKLLREKRAESNRRMREGMKSGEEKYLPARDQGPVKRFVRDWVDARLTFAEFLLPVLVLIMIGNSVPNDDVKSIINGLWLASILLLLVDTVLLRFRLRKALTAKFPDESLKGTTFYAYIRMLQIRFMRLPKPQVRVGGKPR
ncbi:DUF3043 domain-containing protein [Nocardioides marmoriginsengisoli]|uniref:DUF3043 domain-containing protein n=1 Tax=Nocardioides marmoriginsengisoli TaxID=661483 RepID=A0A3N0CLF4_9ACTN|nr:DUF3043 domain-containing protein [Nocardioides marmoriginsengisoli]RNL64270.1 DUF3043 domain-containing protein [Nocardioides marmoriginsengisoli]